MPNEKSSQFGGVYSVVLVVTRQSTSASGSAPPA
jgi:hypothetical protein